jgi:hypothetical protein
MLESLPLRVEARKCGEQARMNVKNVIAMSFDEVGREQTHIASKTDKVYFVFSERRNYLTIMLLANAAPAADHQRLQAALFGESDPRGIWLVTDYSGDPSIGNATFANGPLERKHV